MAYQPEVEKLEKQYQTNPDQYFAPLADAYRKAGNLDFALDIVRNGLAKRPNYLSAHIVLGRCLLDQKNDPEAAKVFEQVLVLDAENIIALRYLGEISERSGDGAGAQRWLKRLLDVDPMNDDAVEALKRLESAPPAAPEAIAEPPAAAVEPEATAESSEPAQVAGFESTVMDASEPAAVAPEPEPAGPPSDNAANEFGIEQASSPFEEPVESGGADISNFGMESSEMTFGEDGQPVSAGAKLDLQPPEPELVTSLDEPPPADAPESEAPASYEPPMLGFEQPPESPAPPAEEPVEAFAEPEPEPEPAPAPEPVRSRKSVSVPPPAFGPTSDLPLIMPDELEPVHAAPPSPTESLEPEPVITETMAEVYVKQGLYAEAKDVYRKLVQQRPGDHALRAKLAKLEQQRPTPPRGLTPTVPAPASGPAAQAKSRFAAVETGGVSARSFFGRVLASKPGAPPAPPPPPITPGSGSAMDAAFADDGAAPPTQGAPTRPTSDELSLAEVFGEEPVPVPPPQPKSAPAPTQPAASGNPGFSFDEFFGNKPTSPAPAPPPAEAGTESDGSSPDDFVAWLKGLKS
jgi:tetratricopeptide (TPR) repeat protein